MGFYHSYLSNVAIFIALLQYHFLFVHSIYIQYESTVVVVNKCFNSFVCNAFVDYLMYRDNDESIAICFETVKVTVKLLSKVICQNSNSSKQGLSSIIMTNYNVMFFYNLMIKYFKNVYMVFPQILFTPCFVMMFVPSKETCLLMLLIAMISF